MATIEAINISMRRGVIKTPVESAELRIGHGIVGDAHAGAWHRQISLLAQESIDGMTALGVEGLDPDPPRPKPSFHRYSPAPAG